MLGWRLKTAEMEIEKRSMIQRSDRGLLEEEEEENEEE